MEIYHGLLLCQLIILKWKIIHNKDKNGAKYVEYFKNIILICKQSSIFVGVSVLKNSYVVHMKLYSNYIYLYIFSLLSLFKCAKISNILLKI